MSSSISKPGRLVQPSKFSFDKSFDALAGNAAANHNFDIFTADDIAQAREQGHAAGPAEAQGETENLTALTLTAIRDTLAGLHRTQAGVLSAVTDDSARLAVALTCKLAASVLDAHPLNEVERLLADVLGRLSLEPRMVVWVTDTLLDPLTEKIDEITQATGYDGKVVLLASPEMQAGDCRIEWADGGTERVAEEMTREINTTVERLLSVGLEPGTPDPASQSARSSEPAQADPTESSV